MCESEQRVVESRSCSVDARERVAESQPPSVGGGGVARRRVSVITTVLNEAENARVLLESLPHQTRVPDEFIIVDGGSTDGTVEVIRLAAERNPRIKLIESPGVNIGRGRNIAIEAASGDVIASTDTGCRLDERWLEEIVRPFEDDRDAEFVAGVYEISPETFFETVVGTTTMRGVLDPIDPVTFNPSGRSMAFTKRLWRRAGGIPDFLGIDDTLYDIKIRSMNVRWVCATEAVVYWRPRGTIRSLARQFRFYGTSAGHTQIQAESCRYNIRNVLLILLSGLAGIYWPGGWMVMVGLVFYFYGYACHGKSVRVMRSVGGWRGYFVSHLVQWVVTISDAVGYVSGSVDRLLDPERYEAGLARYLSSRGEERCEDSAERSQMGALA
jgi:glycosyltransferase involved in cell wall biosynthesis